MNIFVKRGPVSGEAWIEVYCPKQKGLRVVCEATLIFSPQGCFIDTILTYKQFRGMGYATALVNKLRANYRNVKPLGVTSRTAQFWNKFGMQDALITGLQ